MGKNSVCDLIAEIARAGHVSRANGRGWLSRVIGEEIRHCRDFLRRDSRDEREGEREKYTCVRAFTGAGEVERCANNREKEGEKGTDTHGARNCTISSYRLFQSRRAITRDAGFPISTRRRYPLGTGLRSNDYSRAQHRRLILGRTTWFAAAHRPTRADVTDRLSIYPRARFRKIELLASSSAATRDDRRRGNIGECLAILTSDRTRVERAQDV